MRITLPIVTAVTLAVHSAALVELARSEEMFRPVLRASDAESCRTGGAAAGCARFEGYIYVSTMRSDGASRDGFNIGPANPRSAPALEGKQGYLHLGSGKP